MGLKVLHLMVVCPRHAKRSYRATAKAKRSVTEEKLLLFFFPFFVESFYASEMASVRLLGNDTDTSEQG